MQLQQLRYLLALAASHYNVTEAAGRVFKSQPGVSRQLRLLEEELGVPLFERDGRQITGLTAAGRAVRDLAESALANVEAIRRVAQEFSAPGAGELSIATTHTQARYVLPPVIRAFRRRYPDLSLHLHQGSPTQNAEMAASGAVDFAIATESLHLFEELVMLPCYRWNRAIVVPRGHPLESVSPLTLEAVAAWPILTYVFGFTDRSHINAAFQARGLTPRVALTATDADVIKTYIRLGLGVGILASMAYDEEIDDDLVFLDAAHLFEPSMTKIGFRKGLYLRPCHYDFIHTFADHLDRATVDRAIAAPTPEARAELFAGMAIRDY
ncbi:MAG: HTH-type transcriptional regulator CysB [Thiobacillaceae bacterium]